MLGSMLFGQKGGDYFEVAFDAIDPSPDADRYRGINVSLTFAFGSFKGGFMAYLFAGEIRQLLTDLQTLSRTMTGTATFEALEKQIAFSALLNPTGSMIVTGELWDDHGSRNRLLFEMNLDQTYLASPIASLERFVLEHL